MRLFKRSTKVGQQEVAGTRSVKDVSTPSIASSNMTSIRERMSGVAKDDRPPQKVHPKPKKPKLSTEQEKKNSRVADKKELLKKKEERSNKIQALIALRQASSALGPR